MNGAERDIYCKKMAEADRNFSNWPMGYSCFIFTSSHIEELDFYHPPP
jgi:hypothetical protein